jgi:SAM-dependent methyltransferase
MGSYSTVHEHHAMMFDDLRNELYQDAISKAVNDQSIVLDLGAGLGIHGFMAARLGAKKVYLVEPSPIIDITRKLADANKLSDRVECHQEKIEEVTIPEQVDVITSVFMGNFLLTEDLLPSLFYARDKYLKPGGSLIPDRAIMEIVPVSAPEYYARHIDCWTTAAYEIDTTPVRSYAANSLYYDGPENRLAEFLANPVDLLEMDFMTEKDASCYSQIEMKTTQTGLCHGWLGWFKTRLGDQWLSTSPTLKQTHWRQVFLPLEQPIAVKAGDCLSFKLHRPEFGEWTWTTGHGDLQQRQSTFMSEPASVSRIQKRSDGFLPHLSAKGVVAQEILSLMNGNQTTDALVAHIALTFPDIFPNNKVADQFVKELIVKYAR